MNNNLDRYKLQKMNWTNSDPALSPVPEPVTERTVPYGSDKFTVHDRDPHFKIVRIRMHNIEINGQETLSFVPFLSMVPRQKHSSFQDILYRQLARTSEFQEFFVLKKGPDMQATFARTTEIVPPWLYRTVMSKCLNICLTSSTSK